MPLEEAGQLIGKRGLVVVSCLQSPFESLSHRIKDFTLQTPGNLARKIRDCTSSTSEHLGSLMGQQRTQTAASNFLEGFVVVTSGLQRDIHAGCHVGDLRGRLGLTLHGHLDDPVGC